MTIEDFFTIYNYDTIDPMLIIGFAGRNRSDLDQNQIKLSGILNGIFLTGHQDPQPVTDDILSETYYGLEFTRMKVYRLINKSKRKRAL